MVDWSKTFKSEYDAARTTIGKESAYATKWQSLVRKLAKLMDAVGFDAGQESALGELRTAVTKGEGQNKISEDKGILQAAGAWTDGSTGVIAPEAKKRAASLKFLRHTYLLNKFGNHKVWVFNLPTDFKDWPSRYLATNASTAGQVKLLLASGKEHFSDRDRARLGSSTQNAMAWCQKAGIILANAAPGGSTPNQHSANARALVSRWFAEPGLLDATLNTSIATLTQGFKKIIATLNKGHFVVTDWVPFRGTTLADELDFLQSEAFTFRSFGEGMDVVYIESNFFTPNANVLGGQANWTRILVHELSHLVCGTEDVQNGQARYAWYGIGPHAGYPNSDCIKNAENWAFFAADCGGALSQSERNLALKII